MKTCSDIASDRMIASPLARHTNLIVRFSNTHGEQALEALDDVIAMLRCGREYEVNFTSRLYKDARELIEAVGAECAGLLAAFVREHQDRDRANALT